MEDLREKLNRIVEGVRPPDALAEREAEERQAKLAKPPGSLGRLEELSVRLAGVTGKVRNSLEKKRILVFAADNGVRKESRARRDR